MLSGDVLTVIAFAIYIVIFAILRLDARIGIGAALALLVTAAIILAIGNGDLANRLVMYACYFLASGGVLLLIEHIRGEPKRHEEGKERPTPRYSKQPFISNRKRRGHRKSEVHQSPEQVLDKGARG